MSYELDARIAELLHNIDIYIIYLTNHEPANVYIPLVQKITICHRY